jgi:hypothetical protein
MGTVLLLHFLCGTGKGVGRGANEDYIKGFEILDE